MNLAEGMSDEEIDFWADLFYQAKISGVIEVTFSQFISEPFTHLGAAPNSPNQTAKKATAHLALAPSINTPKKPAPKKGPNSPFLGFFLMQHRFQRGNCLFAAKQLTGKGNDNLNYNEAMREIHKKVQEALATAKIHPDDFALELYEADEGEYDQNVIISWRVIKIDEDGQLFGDFTEQETDERELILEHSIEELGSFVTDAQKAIFSAFEPQLAAIRRARYMQCVMTRLADVINQKVVRH